MLALLVKKAKKNTLVGYVEDMKLDFRIALGNLPVLAVRKRHYFLKF
jgi:hypothetical protein